ncbi:MAG: hypothetical protein L6Q76_28860, partial [Polyangiaceae bacterium]|nr:hypothetical protein [Polyangiaceae bacterium]
DAGGYLYNYHNQGPGYDYLGQEGRDTSSPLSGQRSGISYWRDQLPDRGAVHQATDSIGDVVMDGVVGGIDAATELYHDATDALSDAYNGATDWASDKWNSLWD